MKAVILGSLFLVSTLSLRSHAKAAFEVIPLDEASKNQALAGLIRSGLKKQRDVHTKSHGCVEGVKLKVSEKPLDKTLQLGIFAEPGKEYEGVIRLSNGSGEPAVDDKAGGGQGFALKLFLDEALQKKVHVTALEKYYADAKYYRTQDFLGINRVPEFFVESVDDYFAFFGGRKAAGDAVKKAMEENEKLPPEKRLKDIELAKHLKKVGEDTFDAIFIHPAGQPHRERQFAVAARTGAVKTLDPFVEEYFSMVPSRLNTEAVKYRMRPCEFGDPNAVTFPKHINPETNKDYLRAMAQHRLASGEICYKLAIQVHKEGMPAIESASDAWSTAISDYVDVATITIPQKKEVGKELMNDELCETISFTPWHSIPEHLPVGGVQRTRETVYAVISDQRNINAGRKEVPKQ